MASKQARAHEFSSKTRKNIYERDHGQCIFCMMNYAPDPSENYLAAQIKGVMHYIPRSKGGLGIEQNGAIGCEYHHHRMDNGNKGDREVMLELFKQYLKSHYVGWDEENLIYKKGV